MKVEKASKTGPCFGVRRAIRIVEKLARERGRVETLGAVVHNPQVLQKLEKMGVRVARDLDDIRDDLVVTSSHGVSPEVEAQISARHIEVISTTCPFVRRAQMAARRLAESDFTVVIFGDARHPEVKGILGFTQGKGLAAEDTKFLTTLQPLPHRLGILSQTTQVPAQFIEFARDIIGAALTKDTEIRVIDTICHDIRERQAAALELARRVDLMLVVGGRHSANTQKLTDLCKKVTETHQIETADEIEASWLTGKKRIGVTTGASTAEETLDEVLKRLTAS